MTQLNFLTQAEQRQRSAAERLQMIVEERRASFQCIDFARRRAAALKGRRGVAS